MQFLCATCLFQKLVVPHFKHISFVSLTSLVCLFLTNCSKLFQLKQIVDCLYFIIIKCITGTVPILKMTFFLLHLCVLHPHHYGAYVCRRDPHCVPQERQTQFHNPNHCQTASAKSIHILPRWLVFQHLQQKLFSLMEICRYMYDLKKIIW